jgi:glycosyltransferase involved in cell wall biosynthesis
MQASNLPLNLEPSTITRHQSRPRVFESESGTFSRVAPRRTRPLRIAVVGNHLPRQCGIATFTTDLCDAIAADSVASDLMVVAVNDAGSLYAYPERVRYSITEGELSSYQGAAKFLNSAKVDVVCLQHEYGIFGGKSGSHVLRLLQHLEMPVVTTLHTVLREPDLDQRLIMEEIAARSDQLVVMSKHSARFLRDVFRVPNEKINLIPHGIPDLPFVDPEICKRNFSAEGKNVLLTFGLLSPNKGFENVIQALPSILSQHSDVIYIIAGATHPHVKLREGDRYRLQLQALARELGVEQNVVFHNRFFTPQGMASLVSAADIYITPYSHEAQAVSGTLAFAMGAGKAIISTPYWHATELLDDGRGMLVPFQDPGAIAAAAIDLLENGAARQAMRERAYFYGRDMVWNRVARSYMRAFGQANVNRMQTVSQGFSVQAVEQIASSRLLNA